MIRGGNWTDDLSLDQCDSGVCWGFTGSAGHPLYIMAYPGEVVQTDR